MANMFWNLDKTAKQQPFIVVSDFALLYLIRRYGARYQSLSSINSSCGCSYSPYYPQVSFAYAAQPVVSFGKKTRTLTAGGEALTIKPTQIEQTREGRGK